MDYKDTLQAVRDQNPGKPYRWCQKKASEIWNAYKESEEAVRKQQADDADTLPYVPDAGTISTAELFETEKKIRESGPVDVATVMRLGLAVIPNGHIISHGKAANLVNTLITFEDSENNRLPLTGFFEVFYGGK